MDESSPDALGAKPDGRRLRRERGRVAVIDGLIELLFEGVIFPTAKQMAERSGVSHMSVHRYFDGIDDLRGAALGRWLSSNPDVLEIDRIGVGDLPGRIERLVDARLRLYETGEPFARMFRVRALEMDRAKETLRFLHEGFVAQIRQQLGTELALMSEEEADRLVAAIATMMSFESWDLLRKYHDFDHDQIRATWSSSVAALMRAI